MVNFRKGHNRRSTTHAHSSETRAYPSPMVYTNMAPKSPQQLFWRNKLKTRAKSNVHGFARCLGWNLQSYSVKKYSTTPSNCREMRRTLKHVRQHQPQPF